MTQHLYMALLSFLLFGLLIALYGGFAPIPLFHCFAASQILALCMYGIEWSHAKKGEAGRRKLGHVTFRNLSPKGMTILIVSVLIIPALLWGWGFWMMRVSEANAHRFEAEQQLMQTKETQQIAMMRAEMKQLQAEMEHRAEVLKSINDPVEKSRIELEQQKSASELQQQQDLISKAEERVLDLRTQSHDTHYIETPIPWAMMLTTLVPMTLVVTSLYGWRILNRIRRGVIGRDYILPGMLAAMPLTLLVVDAAVGALILLPFNHGVWVNAGISLSIIAIIAVDVWLVRRVLSWLNTWMDQVDESFCSTKPESVKQGEEEIESNSLNASQKEEKIKFILSIFVITVCFIVCAWDYFDRKTKLLVFESDYDRISAPYQNGSVIGADVGIPLVDQLETARERQRLINSALFEREEIYAQMTAVLEEATDPTFRKAVTDRLNELETDISQLKNSLDDSHNELKQLEPVRQALLKRTEVTRRLSKRNMTLICSSMFLCCLSSIFGFKTLRRIRNGKAPHLSAAVGCLIALCGPLFVIDFFIFLISLIKFRNPPLGIFVAVTFDICVFLITLAWVRGWSLAVTKKPFTNNQSD